MIDALLTNDPTGYGDYFQNRRNPGGSPLRRLYLAILADAINCFRKSATLLTEDQRRHSHHQSRLAREAQEWFEQESRAPFGFGTICDELEIDAGELRARLIGEAAITLPRAAPGRTAVKILPWRRQRWKSEAHEPNRPLVREEGKIR